MGFRPDATVAGWLLTAGILLPYVLALSWPAAVVAYAAAGWAYRRRTAR